MGSEMCIRDRITTDDAVSPSPPVATPEKPTEPAGSSSHWTSVRNMSRKDIMALIEAAASPGAAPAAMDSGLVAAAARKPSVTFSPDKPDVSYAKPYADETAIEPRAAGTQPDARPLAPASLPPQEAAAPKPATLPVESDVLKDPDSTCCCCMQWCRNCCCGAPGDAQPGAQQSTRAPGVEEVDRT